METPGAKPPAKRPLNLDSEESRKVLRQLEEWLETEKIRQAPNRYQMALDDDFYDGLQFSDEDAQLLRDRGQAPLVYNKIQPAVKWVTGTEKRTRFNYKVFPRSDGDIDEAANKTKVMAYIDDVNKSAFSRSRGFESAARVGIGWLECGIRGDPTMEPIYDRMESWRNVIYDSQGTELDCSDWRYQYRHKWVDLDIAQALFPKYKETLKSTSVYSDYADHHEDEEWYLGQILQERSADGTVLNRNTFIDTSSSLFNRRARVRLNEAWFRRPVPIKYIQDPTGERQDQRFDQLDEQGRQLLSTGVISTYSRMGMQMWCAIFVRGQLLQLMPSPYRHNDFPFTPIWANRRGRDNAPYGMVRVTRDPQESFNKRMSKALFAMSTRRVVMDVGAVADIDVLREEAARPDGIIEKNHGADFDMATDMQVAEEHLKYAMLDEKSIQDLSGVTDDLMGRKSNAISGKAIEARQDQGSTVTTDLFDNYRLAIQLHGQKKLSLIRQYMTVEQQIRVIGEKKGTDFITINQAMPDGSIKNDMAQAEADFVIDETDYRTTQRQAMFETLMEMVVELGKVNPQFAMNLVDDVLEFSDVPGKDHIIATIRAMTGKPDPNKRLTDEEKQAIAQKQAEEQAMKEEQQRLVLEGARAKVEELQARANKLNAEAENIGAGDDGELAASYNQKLQQLHDDTTSVIDNLRKQLIEAERQITTADMRALDHSHTAQLASTTTIAKTLLDNASKERIASAADRTAEATSKQLRAIDGLNEQLQALSQMTKGLERKKLDKPVTPKADPFQKLHERVDSTDEKVNKVAEDVKGKAPLPKATAAAAAADPRVDELTKNVQAITDVVNTLAEKERQPAVHVHTELGEDERKSRKAEKEAGDQRHQQLADSVKAIADRLDNQPGPAESVDFDTDDQGRIKKARINRKAKPPKKESSA
jgi:hypothetical protein